MHQGFSIVKSASAKEETKVKIRSPPERGLHGDRFALRDFGESRQHHCGIAVQDLRARYRGSHAERILADLRFRKSIPRSNPDFCT